VTFTYDDDGNVTAKTTPDGTTQYRWDSENRLIGITKPDGTAIAYQYDELGRRIGKRVGSQQWRWSYLGQGQQIHQDNGPSGQQLYIHGPGIDEPLRIVGGYQYFIADGLGSIRQIVNLDGQVLNQYRYTAFGKMKQVQESFPNAYTYTGREWDADAGLYYYRARWYDADVGRFMSEDPMGFRGGDVNLVRYVANNPVNKIDPLGLQTIPPELRSLILDQIAEMVIVKGVGGLYAQACASSYCKRRAIPLDVIATLAECLSIINDLHYPPGHPLYGTDVFLSQCADECLRVTHTDAFQQECDCSKKK
jgi:RHS repeat-associated protein